LRLIALAVVLLALIGCQTRDEPQLPPPTQPPLQPFDGVTPPPARPLPSPDGGIDQGGAIRPIPGSLAMFESNAPGKAAETVEKVKEIKAKGHKLSDFFPKMLAVAKMADLKDTDVVADIGAGTGLLAISMLEHDVPFAKLYAVDIDKPSLELGARILDILDLPRDERVQWVFSATDDVRLPPASIDVGIFINSPFYEARADEKGKIATSASSLACLKSLAAALKDTGRVHVIEAAGGGAEPTKPRRNFEIPFEDAGFSLASVDESFFFNMSHYHFVWVKK